MSFEVDTASVAESCIAPTDWRFANHALTPINFLDSVLALWTLDALMIGQQFFKHLI